MRTSRVLTFTVPLVLSSATAAFAATSGTRWTRSPHRSCRL
jgi:hypothetical protein